MEKTYAINIGKYLSAEDRADLDLRALKQEEWHYYLSEMEGVKEVIVYDNTWLIAVKARQEVIHKIRTLLSESAAKEK